MRLAAAIAIVAAVTCSASAATLKKDRARSTVHGPTPRPGAKPAPLVNLYNQWTHEWLAVDPHALPDADTADHFLRDHFTNKPARMDPHLIEILVAAAQHFHSDRVDIVSAFRHPKYNLILRKKGHQVARDSQHTHGNAVDFFIPNVTTQHLHAWAKEQKRGGVGLYLDSGFVHMDTGTIRYWSGE